MDLGPADIKTLAADLKTAIIATDGFASAATVSGTPEASLGVGDGVAGTISLVDGAISSVSGARAELGAVQNRFGHTMKHVNVSVETLSAADSRLRVSCTIGSSFERRELFRTQGRLPSIEALPWYNGIRKGTQHWLCRRRFDQWP